MVAAEGTIGLAPRGRASVGFRRHQEWPGNGSSNLGRTPKVLSSAPAGGCGPTRGGNEVFGSPPDEGVRSGARPGDDVSGLPVGERATGAWLPGDPLGHRQLLRL